MASISSFKNSLRYLTEMERKAKSAEQLLLVSVSKRKVLIAVSNIYYINFSGVLDIQAVKPQLYQAGLTVNSVHER